MLAQVVSMHFMKSLQTYGFMLQVVEWDDGKNKYSLGAGQEIEEETALALGVKIFKIYVGQHHSFCPESLRELKEAVQELHSYHVLHMSHVLHLF